MVQAVLRAPWAVVLLIVSRCIYWLVVLTQAYGGKLERDEALRIALEVGTDLVAPK